MKKVCSLLLVMVLLLSVCQSALAAKPDPFTYFTLQTTRNYRSYTRSTWTSTASNRLLLMNSLAKDLEYNFNHVDTTKTWYLGIDYTSTTGILWAAIASKSGMYYVVAYIPGDNMGGFLTMDYASMRSWLNGCTIYSF